MKALMILTLATSFTMACWAYEPLMNYGYPGPPVGPVIELDGHGHNPRGGGDPARAPEPSTVLLIGAAGVALGFRRAFKQLR